MKFVVFGASRRVGLVDGGRVLDLRAAAREAGRREELFLSLTQLVEAGAAGLDAAAALLDKFSGTDNPQIGSELSAVELHAPFPGRRFALAGSNNAAHVSAYHLNHGRDVSRSEVRERSRRDRAGGFWAIAEPVGPGADIPVPDLAAGRLDYEAEVAVVLGIGGKRLRVKEADDAVWGSVLVIDWSIRTDSMSMPWYGHKNFDSSKSLGPWISVGELDPLDVMVETRVNGELRQHFVNGADMIFNYAELLQQLSENVTLLPGDLLAGGTGPGTVLDATKPEKDGTLPVGSFLQPGDLVEVSSPGLGTLSARVVASR